MKKPSENNQPGNWHRIDIDSTAQQIDVDVASGLSGQEAKARLESHGPNEISSTSKRSPFALLLSQFSDFMILVLIAAAAISGFLGEPTDALVILVILILNAVIGFAQDFRAEKALEALSQMAASHALVRRDGEYQEVPAAELVPGDVVLIEAGNIIPADLRLIEAANLQVNEASLTGESYTVEKQSATLETDTHALGDRTNMAYKGCVVSNGRGEGICVTTGMDTEFGKVAKLLDKNDNNKTPLQQRLGRFGKRLSLIILSVCGLIFGLSLLRGEDPGLMFLTAVSLAVAAIPEALPAIVTVSLALGAKRMVQSNALIRRLPAVEALGSVTYICSDKTGTLTQNRMSLEAIQAGGTRYESLPPADESEFWQTFGQALALNNDVQTDAQGQLLGDPTEVALYEAATAAGYNKLALEQAMPRVGEVAFSSERKCMTTMHSHASAVIAFTKGAPEAILERCSEQMAVDGSKVQLDQQAIHLAAEDMAKQGYRVLAMASRHWDSNPANQTEDQIERELCFLGLIALIDPPRDSAKEAVAQCHDAGIKVVMITGDHPATALAIAQRLGIASEHDKVISGEDLEALSDEALKASILDTTVYARVNPEQKIRIVESLQSHQQFVAMTGDGVNDAPALKRADVGVAMGKIGTEVAREASQLVLLDDEFKTIVTAVKEGRRIFDNIRKFIKYTMTSNTGEILTLLLAPLLGMPIPLLPIHILWINLVTDGLPGLALSVEPAEKEVMKRPPRPSTESIFSHGMWQHMLWVGFLIAALSLSPLVWADLQSSEHWQTMVFTTLTFCQLVHVIAIRSERESLFSIGFTSNPILLITVVLTVGLQLIVIYTPWLQSIFKTQPLSLQELGLCMLLSSVIFFAVEIEKWLARRGFIYANVEEKITQGTSA